MIDVVHEISSVDRRVGTRTLEAGEARTVTVSRVYDTPRDDLWDACTNPERISRWFLPVTGDLRLGGQYQLASNGRGASWTRDPNHWFTATWEYGGAVSWIEVRLAPESAGGTHFELEHIAHVTDERWAQ